MEHKILVLGGKGTSTFYLLNWLEKNNYQYKAILEDSISKKKFFSYRIKKLGLIEVVGQILFLALINPALRLSAKNRKQEIIEKYNLNGQNQDEKILLDTSSINNPTVIQAIKKFNPSIILVNGTRIISKKILNASNAKFVNMHAGITPAYRGVHGAYWALANKTPNLAGVTLHYVDSGVDTGNIIGQKKINTNRRDNFTTFPLIQFGEGLTLLKDFLESGYESLADYRTNIPEMSKQWYHPTIWKYISNYFKGIK